MPDEFQCLMPDMVSYKVSKVGTASLGKCRNGDYPKELLGNYAGELHYEIVRQLLAPTEKPLYGTKS